MKRLQAKRLDIPAERDEVARADLIFYGVDHSGPTYEGRVFLNNPKASEKTAMTAEEGYAGSSRSSVTGAVSAPRVTALQTIASATSSIDDRRTP